MSPRNHSSLYKNINYDCCAGRTGLNKLWGSWQKWVSSSWWVWALLHLRINLSVYFIYYYVIFLLKTWVGRVRVFQQLDPEEEKGILAIHPIKGTWAEEEMMLLPTLGSSTEQGVARSAAGHPVHAFPRDLRFPSPLWCESTLVILRARKCTSGKHCIPQRIWWPDRTEPTKDESKSPWIEDQVS